MIPCRHHRWVAVQRGEGFAVMRTDRGEEGVVIRERQGESLRFRATTEAYSKIKQMSVQHFTESHPGRCHVSLRLSGTSRVKDELVAAHADVRVKGSKGLPGMSRDVMFTVY